MINQCLNVCTLLHIRTSIFLYLKASAIADILSIVAFIPFLFRHAKLIDPSWELGMFYHAHLELPLINALISARYVRGQKDIPFWCFDNFSNSSNKYSSKTRIVFKKCSTEKIYIP